MGRNTFFSISFQSCFFSSNQYQLNLISKSDRFNGKPYVTWSVFPLCPWRQRADANQCQFIIIMSCTSNHFSPTLCSMQKAKYIWRPFYCCECRMGGYFHDDHQIKQTCLLLASLNGNRMDATVYHIITWEVKKCKQNSFIFTMFDINKPQRS